MEHHLHVPQLDSRYRSSEGMGGGGRMTDHQDKLRSHFWPSRKQTGLHMNMEQILLVLLVIHMFHNLVLQPSTPESTPPYGCPVAVLCLLTKQPAE